MKLFAFETAGGGVFFRTEENYTESYPDYKCLGSVEVDSKTGKKERQYPKLRKHKDTELIVLFTSKDEGIVVVPNELHPIGEKSKTWCGTNFHDIDLLPLDKR